MRAISALTVSVLLAIPATGLAQDIDSIVHGAGYKVGEGSVLSPTVGLESEYVSNVFYEETSPSSAGVLRVLAGLAVASLPPERTEATSQGGSNGSDPALEYHLGATLAYEHYVGSTDAITEQSNLSGHALAKLTIAPRGSVRFAAEDAFARHTRPVNFESSRNLDRDINQLRVTLGWHPRGRTLSADLRYENLIDAFESEQSSFANRIQHTIGLKTTWQYLPVTQFYLDASQGIYSQLGNTLLNGETYKQDALPLRIFLGARSALTDATTLRLSAGFVAGFYSAGPSYMTAAYGAEFGYRYSPLGRFVVELKRDFVDSINANYYGTYRLRASLEHQVERVQVGGRAWGELRQYEGVPGYLGGGASRSDVVLGATADVRYYVREWLAASAEYNLAVDQTDYRSMVDAIADDPSYVRHELGVSIYSAF